MDTNKYEYYYGPHVSWEISHFSHTAIQLKNSGTYKLYIS